MTRKRVGLIIPSMNTTLEPDFARTVPATVSVHAQRLWAPPRPTREDVDGPARLTKMNSRISDAVDHLMTAQVDVLVYGCTSGSFSFGDAGDRIIGDDIAQQSGRTVVVTTTALLDALERLGVRRLSVASPYPEATNARLRTYLEHHGYDVVTIAGDPIGSQGSFAMVNEEPADIRAFARSVFDRRAEALVCPCTAWRALEVATQLEEDLGVPVVTSNLAAIWQTLARLDEPACVSGLSLLKAQAA